MLRNYKSVIILSLKRNRWKNDNNVFYKNYFILKKKKSFGWYVIVIN